MCGMIMNKYDTIQSNNEKKKTKTNKNGKIGQIDNEYISYTH